MKRLATLFLCIIIGTYSSIVVFAGTWEQDSKGWRYKLGNEYGSKYEGQYIWYGCIHGIDNRDAVYCFKDGYLRVNEWIECWDGRMLHSGPDGRLQWGVISADGRKTDHYGYLVDEYGNQVEDPDVKAEYMRGIKQGELIDGSFNAKDLSAQNVVPKETTTESKATTKSKVTSESKTAKETKATDKNQSSASKTKIEKETSNKNKHKTMQSQ